MTGTRWVPQADDGRRGFLQPRTIGLFAIVTSVVTAVILALRHATLVGPGDELRYYEQAADLFPYRDNYYGPLYYIVLRLVHALGFGWYEAGKLIGVLSACAFIALSHQLFRRVLTESLAWYATALVAINAQVIAMSYSTLTIMFGAVWVLAAIVTMAALPAERSRGWIIAGLLLGVGGLARSQALGFLLGALAFTVFLPGAWRHRARAAALLVIGAAVPLLSWKVILLLVQGGSPQSYNFIHLTLGLGEFTRFQDVDQLVAKYGSTWGVLTADPLNLPRIIVYGIGRMMRLPIRDGVQLLGPAGFFLVPGALVVLARRETYAPWVGAFAAGLFLTGLASRGWLFYYVPLVPLLAYVIVLAADALTRDRGRVLSGLTWSAVLGGACAWALFQTAELFRFYNWPEWRTVREYVKRNTDSTSVVSSSAASIRYGASFRFVDYDDIMSQHEAEGVVDQLRSSGVTHLVVDSRHMTPEYPYMQPLLDDVPVVPAGLVRDTLIVDPRRVAVYRVIK